MSLKSFDKFCERLILAEPSSQKEIFDERQKIIRSRLSIEALLVYACVTLVNTVVMDTVYQWAENHLSAMVFFMGVCMLYWMIRCAAKGCIIAASGEYSLKWSSIMMIFIGALNLLRCVFDIDGESFFLKDGRITEDFLIIVAFSFFIVGGVFCLCVIRHESKKRDGGDGEKHER